MTLEEALSLQKGDYVTHRTHVDFRGRENVRKPLRVTAVWVNKAQTVVQVRLHAVGGQQWLDATAYDLPPEGQVFDRQGIEWVTPAELERRQKARREGQRVSAA